MEYHEKSDFLNPDTAFTGIKKSWNLKPEYINCVVCSLYEHIRNKELMNIRYHLLLRLYLPILVRAKHFNTYM